MRALRLPPRIAPGPLVGRAVALTLAGWLTFATVETLVHLHAGMGFHGLECLLGPVHRNALPVIGALALLGSALLSAARLVLAWMRRTVGRLVAPRAASVPGSLLRGSGRSLVPRRVAPLGGAPPRGPPPVVA